MLFRFVLPMLATEFFSQLAASIIRVTTAYRVVELGLGPVWLGILSIVFATPALLLAVSFGRIADRGYDLEAAWLGGALGLVASLGLVLSAELPMLLLCMALIGLSNFLFALSFQLLCARYGNPATLYRLLGTYLLMGALTGTLGPSIIAWAGGSAAIPPIHFLYVVAAGFSLVATLCLLALRPARGPKAVVPAGDRLPLGRILKLPGLPAVFLISIMTSTSQDLIGVYLPLYGAERGLGVDTVGTLLAVRSAASVISRLVFDRILGFLGLRTLLVASTFGNALAYLLLFLPLPLPPLYVLLALAGASAGTAMTGSIASALALPLEARGTANSLRMMGNRAGQMAIPFAAGMLAAVTGVAGVFLMMGLGLAGVWAMVQFRLKDLPSQNSG